MARFYKRLIWVQVGLLILLFGIPKLIAAETVQELAMQPYNIEYDVIAKGDKVGNASQSLVQLNNGQWQIAMQSKIKYYFFKDKRQETSRFDFIDGKIFPVQYQRLADSSFKDSNLLQQFDWQTGHETGSYKDKNWELVLQDGVLDQLTQLISLRSQLMAQKPLKPIVISYRGGLRTHQFQVIGQETLKTKIGDIETAKIQLNEKGGKRQTNYWFALEKSMLPVQIQRIKEGKEEAKLVISKW
ncbi:DUF3108 domain-containing protein [Kangiella sp. HZ709]|uniref:DUF3108 domain-containing protein n=1 Tax=Kangiella sp. HZ709 TaxID=2666328 RepID=UPI0018A1FC94|nr:DUF3108 domain-containing protein [Kangiella sp. HZ709]